ncbi:hypothetical protein, partial [Brevundimonas sp. AAP58]|uniref:hypothetical protein n=1 Tax=Brevundimonas sp. AAP58 TaxID=1523422 RepID=UPI001E4FA789
PYAEPPVFVLKTGGFAFPDKAVDPTRRGSGSSSKALIARSDPEASPLASPICHVAAHALLT